MSHKKILPLLAFLSFLGLSAQAWSAEDPEVVPQVDFSRYAGVWFEVAHNPNFFQNGCEQSRAEYRWLSESRVSVVNTCARRDGSQSQVSGTATVVDPAFPAKLEVKFKFNPFKGDYWIVDLDADYQWSVVSSPGKKYLFILSRTAPMNAELQKTIIDRLKSRGFNTDELIYDKY